MTYKGYYIDQTPEGYYDICQNYAVVEAGLDSFDDAMSRIDEYG
ncbi:unnamed protein product [marine sediment metagenome]|uniref:Uncharacterized protein n=1 Tax=marine sediment metagenome TaxID=412755 RepID=X0XBL9_9ZZZZ